eukprot:gene9864-10022_t
MSLQAKKLAQLVNEYRNRPDDRRMQFGHRVKSVTLAEYKPEEVEQMRDGGNQVAAYRHLARYTPDKDLKKPLDRNPQHIRVWIQTVFMDKRFYSADAPVPRRPSDAGSSAAGLALHSAGRASSGALSRTSSTREGAHSVSPVPVSPTPSAGGHQQHLQQSGSPPVRDMRELLGPGAQGRKLLQRQMTGPPEPLMQWLVDKHNELRYRHGVPDLQWDWGLAWNAYNYVTGCPRGHSGQQGIGENLAWGHGDFNHAMRDWYDEIRFYRFMRPGFAENTGHFTMMVWKDAAKIGCAANLRCSFKTWICQFTPPGNLVSYGGSVDVSLWTTQVPAPGQRWVTGTQADGTPKYTSYDPTGASTAGLPQPQYGELKNFGYVPKPGKPIISHDWQKFLPGTVLLKHIPADVLQKYLSPDTLALLKPTVLPSGVKQDNTVVGWQLAIPAATVRQYVPLEVVNLYVPQGIVLGDGPAANRTKAAAPAISQQAAPTALRNPTAKLGKQPTAASGVHKPAPTHVTRAVTTGQEVPSAAQISEGGAAAPTVEQPQQVTMLSPAQPQQAVVGRAAPVGKPSGIGGLLGNVGQLVEGMTDSSTATAQQGPAEPTTPGQPRATDAAFGHQPPSQPQPLQQPQQPQYQYQYQPQYGGPSDNQQQPYQYQYVPASSEPYYGRPQRSAQPATSAFVPAQQGAVYVPAGTAGSVPYAYQLAEVPLPAGYGSSGNNVYNAQPQSAAGYPGYVPPPSSAVPGYVPASSSAVGTYTASFTPTAAAVPGQQVYTQPSATSSYTAAATYQQSVRVNEMQDALDRHNFYRQRHQAPSLVWDLQLAASAAAVVRSCPVTTSGSGKLGVGQNIAWGSASVAVAINTWYAEVDKYDYNNPGFTPNAGGFSQLVWADTQKIGCAVAAGCRLPVVACQYYPAGNVLNVDWTSKVRPAVLREAGQSKVPASSSPPKPASTAAAPATAVPTVGSSVSKTLDTLATEIVSSGAQTAKATNATAPAVPKPLAAAVPKPELQAALDKTNAYRQRHQAAPLAWDDSLASSAATWAAGCPNGHSGYSGVGENMAWGYSTLTDAVDAWYNEVKQYDFSRPGWNTATGHFTALVWTDTTKLGCAVNRDCSWPTYVCQYKSPGNVIGLDWSAKVLSLHNSYRKVHQVPALVWDSKLAASAKAWAGTCRFAVSGTPGVGENLGFGYRSFTDTVKAWYQQVSAYDFSAPGFSPNSGLFSQLVWKNTKTLGCAVNFACPWAMYVCHYGPPGNLIGASVDWKQQVLRPSGALPAVAAMPKPITPGCLADSQSQLYKSLGTAGMKGTLPLVQVLIGQPYSTWNSFQTPNQPGNTAMPFNPLDNSFPKQQQPAADGIYTPYDAVTMRSALADLYKYRPAPRDIVPPQTLAPPTGSYGQQVMQQNPISMQNPSLPTGTPVPTIPADSVVNIFQPSTRTPQQPQVMPPAVQPQITPTTPAPGQQQPTSNYDTPATPAPGQQQPPPNYGTSTGSTGGAGSLIPGLNAELQAGLDRTNQYRQQHQASALQWDTSLAAQASAYIARCPRGHSKTPQVGENLAWGFSSLTDAVDAWYNEVTSYNFANGGYSSSTGHFSQLVWRSSKKVGCAVNKSCPMTTFICQYTPAGNVLGVNWSKQVKPKSLAPASTNTPGTATNPSTTTSIPRVNTPVSTPVIPTATPPTSTPEVSGALLEALQATNAYRAKHQAAALVWDPSIAASAQSYANSCPQGHSGAQGLGENLAWGYPSFKSAIDAWYNEVQSYNFNSPGWSGATGHFTQLVWRETTKVGCGLSLSCSMPTYVCQYAAAGNVLNANWAQQ